MPRIRLEFVDARVDLLSDLLVALAGADLQEDAPENTDGNRDGNPGHDGTKINHRRAEEFLVNENAGEHGGDYRKKGNQRRWLRPILGNSIQNFGLRRALPTPIN